MAAPTSNATRMFKLANGGPSTHGAVEDRLLLTHCLDREGQLLGGERPYLIRCSAMSGPTRDEAMVDPAMSAPALSALLTALMSELLFVTIT